MERLCRAEGEKYDVTGLPEYDESICFSIIRILPHTGHHRAELLSSGFDFISILFAHQDKLLRNVLLHYYNQVHGNIYVLRSTPEISLPSFWRLMHLNCQLSRLSVAQILCIFSLTPGYSLR